MKFLVLNLPYSKNIIRKYSCSYIANGFLYPPVELHRIASILKFNLTKKDDVIFIDAIEERLNENKCLKNIKLLAPDVIITLGSVDFINEEYSFCKKIKNCCNVKIILIGYIPNLYPEKFSDVDEILGNDFESVINLASKSSTVSLEKFLEKVSELKSKNYCFDPDTIKMAEYSFIENRNYSELFVKGKTAITYFSFGCSYKCNFCIRTYGLNKVHYRKTENILYELKEYYNKGIKNIRILDDNCTLNKKLLYDILKFQNENNYKFNFYGLSRIDLIDYETINLLINLNFKSLMIGIESINERTQSSYNKQLSLNLSEVHSKLKLLKSNKVQMSMFIMINPLTDNENVISSSIKFLNNLPVHFASISYVVPYPGTFFFNINFDKIIFKTEPKFEYRIKSQLVYKFKKIEVNFLIKFYILKPWRLFNIILLTIKHPVQMISVFFNVIRFIFNQDKNRDNFF